MSLRRLAAHLPSSWQHELKRVYYRRQIARGTFASDEAEFAVLAQFVGAGDWAIDVGANVGWYTMRLSELVGPHGRVIAVEPVPETFALLAANARQFAHQNVTLLNVAASDRIDEVSMQIPLAHEMPNYYQAAIRFSGSLQVLALALDGLGFPHSVALVKIDAEGHDQAVLRGLARLIARDRPVVIAESAEREWLAALGYRGDRLPGSSNMIFRRA